MLLLFKKNLSLSTWLRLVCHLCLSLLYSFLETAFDEKVYGKKKEIGHRFGLAAAKLYQKVLKFVSARVNVKGTNVLRMAPMISASQMRKIVELEMAKAAAASETHLTGEGGQGHDNDEMRTHLLALISMQTSKPKGANKGQASQAYVESLNKMTDKVRFGVNLLYPRLTYHRS